MKKMVKTLLCLMMALAMSLSLAVPSRFGRAHAFTLSRNHFIKLYVVRSGYGPSHRRNQGYLMRCSNVETGTQRRLCLETETHTDRTTYISNYSGSNPTKHAYTGVDKTVGTAITR